MQCLSKRVAGDQKVSVDSKKILFFPAKSQNLNSNRCVRVNSKILSLVSTGGGLSGQRSALAACSAAPVIQKELGGWH